MVPVSRTVIIRTSQTDSAPVRCLRSVKAMAQEGCARVGCVCDLSVTEMPSLLRTLAAVGRVLFRRESASHREACARTTVPEWCVGSDLSMAK